MRTLWRAMLLVLMSSNAYAEDWNLPELFLAVSANHPEVLAAQQLEKAAKFELEASENQRYPTFAVDRGNVSGGGRQTSIALTQPLYTFGAITKGIEVSRSRLQGVGSQKQFAISELHLQVGALYLEGLRASSRAQIAKESVEAHDELAQAMQRRLDAQLGNSSDRDLSLNRLALAQSELNQAQLLHKRALSALKVLTRKNVGSLGVFESPMHSFETEGDLLEALKLASPELAIAKADFRIAMGEAEVLKVSQLPRLVLQAERVETTVPTPFTDNRLIASVQFTPGAGLSALAARDAAFARAFAAEQQSLSATQTLEEDAALLWADMELAKAEIPILERVEISNKAIVDSFYRQFQAGKRSWVDVVNGMREYVQSRYALVDAKHRYNNAYVQAAIRGGKLDWFGKPTEIALPDSSLQKIQIENEGQMIIEYSVSKQ